MNCKVIYLYKQPIFNLFLPKTCNLFTFLVLDKQKEMLNAKF